MSIKKFHPAVPSVVEQGNIKSTVIALVMTQLQNNIPLAIGISIAKIKPSLDSSYILQQ